MSKSIKCQLRLDKKTPSGVPVVLVVVENRVPKRVALGFKVLEKDFNSEKQRVRRSHPEHEKLNRLIDEAIAKERGVQPPPPKSLLDNILEEQAEIRQRTAAAIDEGIVYTEDGRPADESDDFIKGLNTSGRKIRQESREKEAIEAEKERVWNEYLKAKNTKLPEKSIPGVLEYAEEYRKELQRNGQAGTFEVYGSVIAKLRAYLDGGDIKLNEITVKWLTDYDIYLQTKLKNRINTRKKDLQSIRSLINRAIRNDIIEVSAFKKFKIKAEKSEKKMLTLEQIDAIAALPIPETQMKHHYRQAFVLACFTGLRISDVCRLKVKHVVGGAQGRIVMTTEKTNSQVTIKLVPRASAIIASYLEGKKGNQWVFPFLNKLTPAEENDPTRMFDAISSQTALCNKYLRQHGEAIGLEFSLGFHTARHTMASLLLQSAVPIEQISRLLGHRSIATTQIYSHYVSHTLDAAMDKIGHL